MTSPCEKVFVFPFEILSIIKDFLFNYKKSFSKYILPIIKQNYPTNIYTFGPKSSAREVYRTKKCMYEIIYDVPRYEKMSREKIRSLRLNNYWDRFGTHRYLIKERQYIYVKKNTDIINYLIKNYKDSGGVSS